MNLLFLPLQLVLNADLAMHLDRLPFKIIVAQLDLDDDRPPGAGRCAAR